MALKGIEKGGVAVITGGASGIGLAAAERFAARGLSVVIVDMRDELFAAAAETVRQAGAPRVMTRKADVSNRADMVALEAEVTAELGGATVLMNNAGVYLGTDIFDTKGTFERTFAVNVGGVLNGCHAFGPGMVARGRPGAIINTGSKQGITNPPGDPAYNVSKAGVKTYTELLAHQMRDAAPAISVHLLIPGFVYTDMTRPVAPQQPPSAWTPAQTADFMFDSLDRGDFYILCPDNDVPRALDEKRIAWAAGDLIENRPALSRWHKDYAQAFGDFIAGD